MSNEVPRIYKEIIEEVIRASEEDTYNIGLSIETLNEIKDTWIAKICEYTDIREYKIRHNYSNPRMGVEGYYNAHLGLQEYNREYPYQYYNEKEDKDSDLDQYDGISSKRTDNTETPQNEEELDSNELSESDCDVDNDDSTKNVMLCLFDKVTRVKDKRRCTLKHGFLSIGRTDYIFNIANGDLEW
ncbi:hypothetical protein NEOKW01_1418 [Nematocida sp. AWRm80]|nr:hypothetical protein NEOKW01_1418 [Nematocida sp. AWRm80]